ncbi:hypothetical protein DEDE109153_16305 [Deinococcus deserti]
MLRPVCQALTTRIALNTPLRAAHIDVLAQQANRLVEQASRLGQPGPRDMLTVDAESTAWLEPVLRRFR